MRAALPLVTKDAFDRVVSISQPRKTPVPQSPRRRRRARFVYALAAIGFAAAILVPSPAPANIQEQRARLPPPATCTDPVEGVWMSHKFNPQFGDWYIFTLEVRRAPGSQTDLRGVIRAHSWIAGPQESEPPPCRAGLDHWVVFMTAQGTISPAGEIVFFGTSWRLESSLCGRSPGPGQYNLDRFSGRIDPAIQEFQSVNNDGGRAVNEPTVFRRVRCLDPPTAPHVKVAPPPMRPPSTGGCSLF